MSTAIMLVITASTLGRALGRESGLRTMSRIRAEALNSDVSQSLFHQVCDRGQVVTFYFLKQLARIMRVPPLYRYIRTRKHPIDASYYYNSPGQLVYSNDMVIVV